jgi:hypothetical protein
MIEKAIALSVALALGLAAVLYLDPITIGPPIIGILLIAFFVMIAVRELTGGR